MPEPTSEETPAPSIADLTTPIPTEAPSGRDSGEPLPHAWALLNLLLTLATALISVLALVGYLGKRKRKDVDTGKEYNIKKHGFLRLLTLLPGVGALIVFILTENMRYAMVWTDQWTEWMVVIGLVQLFLAGLCIKQEKELEADEALK